MKKLCLFLFLATLLIAIGLLAKFERVKFRSGALVVYRENSFANDFSELLFPHIDNGVYGIAISDVKFEPLTSFWCAYIPDLDCYVFEVMIFHDDNKSSYAVVITDGGGSLIARQEVADHCLYFNKDGPFIGVNSSHLIIGACSLSVPLSKFKKRGLLPPVVFYYTPGETLSLPLKVM